MDISTVFNPWLAWFTDQLALLSNLPPTYIGLAAIAPLLMALMSRDLLATLWATMLALGAISLCATQEISWAPLAIFAAAAAFLLAVTAVIRRRQSRTLRDELRVDREELCELKERLNVLEMCERRRIMESQRRPLHNMMDTTGLLSPMEDSEKAKIPIAPK